MTIKGRTKRLERFARAMLRPAVWTPDAALMESVLDKARRAVAGEAAEPADWSHVVPAVKAHRERVLECVARGQP